MWTHDEVHHNAADEGISEGLEFMGGRGGRGQEGEVEGRYNDNKLADAKSTKRTWVRAQWCGQGREHTQRKEYPVPD